MYQVKAITDNQELEFYYGFEHEAKHLAIDLAYQGYQTYVYEGDKHTGYKKLYRSEQFGQCFAVVGV